MLERTAVVRAGISSISPFIPVNEGVVLAFDFGLRRIGVAIGNGVTRAAHPLSTIAADRGDRWEQIAELLGEWQPQRLVVGVPRHPDGTPHEMTARCERFARQLEGRFGLPVARVDERYSSAAAGPGQNVDARAAALILQQWFDEAAVSPPRDPDHHD
jgi:putative Holliday junction resolvase